jgi:hypothetical protein
MFFKRADPDGQDTYMLANTGAWSWSPGMDWQPICCAKGIRFAAAKAGNSCRSIRLPKTGI